MTRITRDELAQAEVSSALKPCPFCGCAAHFDVDEDNWEWVECSNCGMQGNRSASLMEDCKPKLIEAWNRRTPTPQAQADARDAELMDFLEANAASLTLEDDLWEIVVRGKTMNWATDGKTAREAIAAAKGE